ncbi:MAG: hypothetical protein ACI31D_01970, partial [Candidatus Limisoma sp.]
SDSGSACEGSSPSWTTKSTAAQQVAVLLLFFSTCKKTFVVKMLARRACGTRATPPCRLRLGGVAAENQSNELNCIDFAHWQMLSWRLCKTLQRIKKNGTNRHKTETFSQNICIFNSKILSLRVVNL